MTSYCQATSLLLVLFLSLFHSHLSTSSHVTTIQDSDNKQGQSLSVSIDPEGTQERKPYIRKDQAKGGELFEDLDPEKLAAILLEALNISHLEKGIDKVHSGIEEETKLEQGRVKKEESHGEESDQDGSRRQELEKFIALQAKERERIEDEERNKAVEEEEKMTEKVNSHTTSQIIQADKQKSVGDSPKEQEPDDIGKNSNEDEEQLNSEELKSLETMMKEFPRFNTKAGGDPEQKQRDSRGFSSYNEIIPVHKGNNLLKWQEETQKAIYSPAFLGDNSRLKSIEKGFANQATEPQPSVKLEVMQEDDPVEEDYEEKVNPEEEEAQAKSEQEEMIRQVAEAQKAKMEEEKLADIASDMLLRYMVKQNHGSSISNAEEEKRSQEELTREDIDPQTIDKLIEISSKLHLPADDVVDIITDVEKKKKDVASPEMASFFQLSSSPSSRWQQSSNYPKSWFKETKSPKPNDFQFKFFKPLVAHRHFLPKPETPVSVKYDRRLQGPKYSWTEYPLYPYTYPSYYRRKPLLGYYPSFFPSLIHKPYNSRPQPALSVRHFIPNSMDVPDTFLPERRYKNWVQPELIKPPNGQPQKSYYTSYTPWLYPQPPRRNPFVRADAPPQISGIASQQKMFKTPTRPAVTRSKDHSITDKQPERSLHGDLERFIQEILMNRPQITT